MLIAVVEFSLRGEEWRKSTGRVIMLVVCDVFRVFRDIRPLVKVEDSEPDGVWAVARTVVVRDAEFPSYKIGSRGCKSNRPSLGLLVFFFVFFGPAS